MTTTYNSCALCGGDGHNQAVCPWRSESIEAQRVAADLSYNAGKCTWHAHNDAQALRQQLQTQDKGEQA